MSFEYWFIRYWWRVFVVLLVAGPIAWIWAPTAMLTILMVYAVVIGSFVGVRHLIGRWRKRKCKIHGYMFPRANLRRNR